jgi:hypothetical protein
MVQYFGTVGAFLGKCLGYTAFTLGSIYLVMFCFVAWFSWAVGYPMLHLYGPGGWGRFRYLWHTTNCGTCRFSVTQTGSKCDKRGCSRYNLWMPRKKKDGEDFIPPASK